MDLEKRTVEVVFFETGDRAKCKVTNAVLDYSENRVCDVRTSLSHGCAGHQTAKPQICVPTAQEALGQKKLKGPYVKALAEADEAFQTAPRHPEVCEGE